MHEELTHARVDQRAASYEGAAFDTAERALAHSYHTWPSDEATAELREAAAALREALLAEVAAPLRRAVGALLGLDEAYLCSRCEGRRSDNTSMLRVLEYPKGDGDGGGGGSAATMGATMGVSEHTDFELFSLLHQRERGLQLRDPSGAWHEPAHGAAEGESSWVLIVGDMLERLSGRYLAATPHRVPPTADEAAGARYSMVFFQALDENELVSSVAPSIARRSPTSGWREWEERRASAAAAPASDVQDGERRMWEQPMTQRDWTEWKEKAAYERLEAERAAVALR